MKKRCKLLSNEFEQLLTNNKMSVYEVEEFILNESKNTLKDTNKIFFSEKLKLYKNFKNINKLNHNKDPINSFEDNTANKIINKKGKSKNKNIKSKYQKEVDITISEDTCNDGNSNIISPKKTTNRRSINSKQNYNKTNNNNNYSQTQTRVQYNMNSNTDSSYTYSNFSPYIESRRRNSNLKTPTKLNLNININNSNFIDNSTHYYNTNGKLDRSPDIVNMSRSSIIINNNNISPNSDFSSKLAMATPEKQKSLYNSNSGLKNNKSIFTNNNLPFFSTYDKSNK